MDCFKTRFSLPTLPFAGYSVNLKKSLYKKIMLIVPCIQVALNQELQELNRAMAIKASVVQAILANNKEMLDSHNNLRENEEKISKLERERDELLQQLKQTKVIKSSNIICAI